MPIARNAARTALVACAGLFAVTACGSGDGADEAQSKQVTLVTHDSFNVSKDVLAEFKKKTGYTVKVLKSGDAGQAVNQAVLSKGNPQGDVLFGVDNTLLSRAVDNGVFAPYEAKGLDRVPAEYQLDAEKHRVTPVDTGDICVNYDKSYFADKKLDPPRTFEDLADPKYKNLLVTENCRHVLAGARLPARDGRRVRRRGLAGLLEEAQGQRREGRRRLGAGVQRGVLGLGRRQEGRRRPAPRRLVRVQPARGGAVRRPAAR